MRCCNRLAVATVTLFIAAAAPAATWHVNDDAIDDPGPGDPLVSDPLEDGSAAHPFDAIQEAIDASAGGDTVLVADGTYTGDGNRDLNYGGRLITVQSENGPAATTVDAGGAGARCFIFNNGEGSDARLEGFTLTGTMISAVGLGGAVFCNGASPTIDDCHMVGNAVTGPGASGGGFSSLGGSPTLLHCLIQNNLAEDLTPAGTARGGGLSVDDALLDFCEVRDNTAHGTLGGGGGGLAGSGAVTITRCELTGNDAFADPGSGSGQGGALWFDDGPVSISDTIIEDNETAGGTQWGGGIYAKGGNADLSLLRVEFNANNAHSGSGLRAVTGAAVSAFRCRFRDNLTDGSYTTEPSSFISCLFTGNGTGLTHLGGGNVTNCTMTANGTGLDAGSGATSNVRGCIFWANTSAAITGTAVTAGYSLVEGGFAGTGIVDGDPLFVNEAIADYRPRPQSPAVDAADNTALPLWATKDLDGQVRHVDYIGVADSGLGAAPVADMGAMEFQGFLIPGDASGDGFIDVNDLVLVISNWGPCPTNACPGNVIIDEFFQVDVNDLVAVFENWGRTDCNFNGIFDDTEAEEGISVDCNSNGIPDECDLNNSLSTDCDGSGVPDECELDVNDCNMNGVHDTCEIADGLAEDCNDNGTPDECEPGDDLNANGVPDECEYLAADSCSGSAPLGTGVVEVFTTFDATTSGPEEDLCFPEPAQIFRDVWFRWTAPCDGTATISLCGSPLNTRMAVYDSCPTLSGTIVACGDDECGLQSQITFPVTDGTIYRIRVGAPTDTPGIGLIEATCSKGP